MAAVVASFVGLRDQTLAVLAEEVVLGSLSRALGIYHLGICR